jgi:hypothetical protein
MLDGAASVKSAWRGLKMRLLWVGIAALGFAIAAAKGGTCIDTPIQWEIRFLYQDGATANAVQGDGLAYVNGVSGVDAVIHKCSGTNDATLTTGRLRSVSVSFAALFTNQYTPSWTSGLISGNWFLNVRNITYVPPGQNRAEEFRFTTRYGSMAPNGSNLRMLNPTSDAVTTQPELANDPYLNSLVNVHHCPANSDATTGLCLGRVKETWFVWPDQNLTEDHHSQTGLAKTQVASLLVSVKGKNVAAGEFTVPFYFVITSLE